MKVMRRYSDSFRSKTPGFRYFHFLVSSGSAIPVIGAFILYHEGLFSTALIEAGSMET